MAFPDALLAVKDVANLLEAVRKRKLVHRSDLKNLNEEKIRGKMERPIGIEPTPEPWQP
jgi:hypothetical protein